MDKIEKVVKNLKKQGVFLKVNGDKLQIKQQKDEISDVNLTELKANKKKIISYLKSKYAPLSFGQERLWFLDKYEHNSSYNLPVAIRMYGVLEVDILKEVLFEIIRRHEILRTNFKMLNNEPRQVVNSIEDSILHKNSKYKLEIIELDHLAKENADIQILKLIEEKSQKPFDLENDCLIRFFLYKISEQESVLFMNKHHIISDGWSSSILTKEISLLYEAYNGNKPSPLEKLPIQYADYSIWQREYLKGEVLTKQSEYWRNKLSGTAILELPTDKIRPMEKTHNGNKLFFRLDKDISGKLDALSKENNVTLFMTLLSVFKVLLNKYTGQDDICVGSPIANRTRSEVEKLIGFFVNTLALRSDLSGNISFVDFIKQIKQTTLDAYSNQDMPFEKVIEIIQPERNLSYSPLFQVMMVLQNNPASELFFGDLSLRPVEFEQTVSKFDLIISFKETAEGLLGEIEYNTNLFEKDRIERMVGHINILVESIISNPTVTISELEILASTEKHKLLVEWNDTEADYPKDKCIHQLFEEQVEKTPLNIALQYEQEELTYHELNDRSNQLARYLQNKGVNSNSKIALIMDRSFEMLISIFGILKSGGCYVPIDSSYPNARINYIIDNSETQLVLTEKAHIDKLDKGQAIEVFEDLDLKEFEVSNLERTSKPTDLSYIIYTSGSTGNPKGVMVGHSSVVNLLHFMQDKFPLTHHDSYLLKTSFCFDVSVIELFGWILGGSKLSILTKDHERDPGKILDAISNFQVTHINFVPSVFKSFSQSIILEEKSKLETLQYIMLAGESLIREHLREFKELGLNIQIENLYGPTEATVYASNSPINLELSEPITIGKPLSNAQMYILGLKNELQGIGIPGELCISGDGLAIGYLNNLELTQEKFIDHPFKEGEKLYKTGDLARWLPDGNIEFLGRIDHQVKIRGFRIELGEIENALLQHESIKEGVVLAREEQDDKYLCAYIVSEGDFNQEAVRTFLSTSLPDYMIPSYFVELDSLPLTSNGKVNRKVLPSPEVKAEVDYVAPSNETEERLVTMWSEVLNRPEEEISVIANFFALGGHSLKATIFINKLFEATGYELKLGDFFNISTIKEISDIFLLVNENSEEDNYQEISI